MLEPIPLDARWVHRAYALAAADVELLRGAAAAAVHGDRNGEAQCLAPLSQRGTQRDERTALDVGPIEKCITRIRKTLARAPSPALAQALNELSLAPREVSAPAERALAARALRYERLVQLDAPAEIVNAEVECLLAAVRALDALDYEARGEVDDGWYALAVRVAVRRFVVGLDTHTDTYAALERWLEERGPLELPPLDVFALGAQLATLPDLADPPPALFEQAILERGVWDESVEREHFAQAHARWIEWRVMDDAAPLLDAIAQTRAEIAQLTPAARREISAHIECAWGELVPCRDWLVPLDARLARIAIDVPAALDEGLMIVGKVYRSLSR